MLGIEFLEIMLEENHGDDVLERLGFLVLLELLLADQHRHAADLFLAVSMPRHDRAHELGMMLAAGLRQSL